MKDCDKFIEDSKVMFKEGYKLLDSQEVNNLELKRYNGNFTAIAGDYLLNCKYKDIVYQQKFYIVVLADRTKRLVLPIVWLPHEKRPHKFEHMYDDKTCCLGTTHEILRLWGEEQSAKTFFEDIIDTFLINLKSFRETGKCATEEWAHGYEGLTQYYSKLLEMTEQECGKALHYIYEKTRRNEYAKGHNLCPCGSNKQLRDCHAKSINQFLNGLKDNKNIKAAFLQDVAGIFEQEKKNGKKI